MTTKTDKILLERHAAKLSFAVYLIDDYSGDTPIGKVDVRLKGRDEKPIKNPSSYYAFLDLPDDTYTVQVRSGYYYDVDSGDINPAELDPKSPVMDITLKPKPSYPFPPGATLIRGMVREEGNALSGARVKIGDKDVEGETTEEGEFVLYFGDLTNDEIIKENGKRFVKGANDKIIHLEVEYGRKPRKMDLEALEGKTTFAMVK